jgi:ribonuclease HI
VSAGVDRAGAGGDLPRVDLWTDGACSGNPGPGGWAALLVFNGHERELSGGERSTTNNRMELMGLLEGLRALTRPVAVTVHTDSAYLEKAFTERWLDRWQANGWKTSGRKPVANRDLWEALLEAAAPHRIALRRVRGHAGVELNERVDRLAVAARDAAAARPR